MPLQLAAVAALIALVFGLPRLRQQPPPIPDPAPRPLVEAATAEPATTNSRPPQRQDQLGSQSRSRSAEPQRESRVAANRKRSGERRPRKPPAERTVPAPQPTPAPQSAPAPEPSAAATPAREFGWP